MTEDKNPYVPAIIEKVVVQLEQATGVEPVVERVGRIWRMTHSGGDHGVKWTALVRPAKRGVHFASREVTVNGERRRCPSWEGYYKLFKGEDPEAFEPVAMIPEIELLEDSAWRPTALDAIYRQTLRQCTNQGVEISMKVGRLNGQYVLDMRFSGAVFQIYFSKTRGQWGIDPREGLLLVSPEGRDLTWAAGGDIRAALAILMGRTAQHEQPASTIGTPRKVPGVANSVQVRRTTVIRN